MMFASKILGILLPLAVMIAPSTTGALADAGHASAPLAVPGHPPAACHMHVDNTLPDSSLPHPPRPAPASYQCCLTGHNAAVVQTSLSPQPCNECARVAVQIEPALALSSSGVEASIFLSAGPPRTTPLRI